MTTIILTILLTVGAACDSDSASTLAGAPDQQRGAPVTSSAMQHTLCCVDSMCVRPVVGQDACAPSMETRECAGQRVGDGTIPVPLWQCQ